MTKFRASSVGALLVGGNAISDKQRQRLRELLDRSNDPDAKPLTAKMQADLDDLIAKRDADLAWRMGCGIYCPGRRGRSQH